MMLVTSRFCALNQVDEVSGGQAASSSLWIELSCGAMKVVAICTSCLPSALFVSTIMPFVFQEWLV
jgi:hypothetical protein